jgi:hypothetical protein
VTDPHEPLYGKRFRVESVSRSSEEQAHVFLRRDDGVVLRVPFRATDLSTLVNYAPRAKLCKQSVAEFLDLVKEYELCLPTDIHKSSKSGRRLKKRRDKKS